MKTATIACLTVFLTLLPSCTPAAKEEAKAVVTHVTADLRDGSRVVGVFAGKTLALDSASVGELQMPVERIRILEWPSDKKPAQLQAANGDKFAVELRLTELPITSSFGEIKVPVGKIRQLRFWTDAGGTNRVPGLVALWSAESDARDSVSGQTAMVSGGVSYVPGKVGQAFSFDGRSGYLQTSGRTDLDFTGPFSITAWVKFDRLTPYCGNTIVAKGADIESSGDWLVAVSANGKLRPHGNVGGTWVYFDCKTQLNFSTWYFTSVVYDGSTLRGYVNGELDGSQPVAGELQTSNQPLRIGAYAPMHGGGSKSFFPGLIDEVSLYNRALNADEIRQLFDAGNTETR